jgi:hypothetical protein
LPTKNCEPYKPPLGGIRVKMHSFADSWEMLKTADNTAENILGLSFQGHYNKCYKNALSSILLINP